MLLCGQAAWAASEQLIIQPNSDCTGSATGTCGLTITITAVQVGNTDTYNVTYDIKNTGYNGNYLLNSTTGAWFQSFSVTAFTGAISGATVTATAPPLPDANYSLTDGSSGNNGNGNNCTGGVSGALCLQMVLNHAVDLSAKNAEQYFAFRLTDSTGSLILSPATWNVKTLVTQFDVTNGSPGAHYVALSTSGTPTPYIPPVPEPASLLMLGTGLMSLGTVLRNRIRK